MKHCKSCRRDLEDSAYEVAYRTCTECRKKKIHTIDKCKSVAVERGGECLSTEYTNSRNKMMWRCNEGHEWSAAYTRIQMGQWCPTCRNSGGFHARITLDKCKAIASERGGECLSTEYKNSGTKMTWRCSKGHEWITVYESLKAGTWCPTCGGTERLTLAHCKAKAIENGGECLSTEYKNKHFKMEWMCSSGHEWKACYNKICYGRWCPICALKKTERICLEIFENMLLESFTKIRPKWLGGLELDGYNEELNIAFEYNGKQHYKYCPFFHQGDPERFELQKQRDIKKYEICRIRGIKLIIIPYQYDYQNPTELKNFIVSELWKVL
jgi:hypothetical protein